MVYCPRCGKELPEGAVYCDGCGQKLNGPTTGPARETRGEWRRREPDYMGGVGFGVFLIIVA